MVDAARLGAVPGRGAPGTPPEPAGLRLPALLPLGLILLALAGMLAGVMPAGRALLLVGTMALGYAAYGRSHFVLHRHRFQLGLGRSWVASHQVHHFRIRTNFGVTTPLWDVLLGTRYEAPSRR